MVTRWTAWLRKIRRWFSRSEWSVRLLGLPRSTGTDAEPGLVLIQIDGLARRQLEQALQKGRMPFLRRLLRREHYQLHTLYSGMPSSTPAVQGELFYGQRSVVPAFSFRDPESGEIVRMSRPGAASMIEEQLRRENEGLLAHGSAYCNIYSGGAEQTNFCASTAGWGEVLRAVNPLKLLSVLFFHGFSFMRIVGLMFVELLIALGDACRGLVDDRDLWKELSFVPARVAVSILLRELATIGAMMDITRGLQVVHVNYLGYDEQAHRRGPSSAFAHWSLKGIDLEIKHLWRAARRSQHREYDVWIYSDHGQEETRPYQREFDRSLEEAVAEVYARYVARRPISADANTGGVQLTRASWLGGNRVQRLFPSAHEGRDGTAPPRPLQVTALGPVGNVYADDPLDEATKRRLARAFVDEAHIPIVLMRADEQKVRAFTPEGEFLLPDEAADVLGNDHPFRHEVAVDLVRMCHGRLAGTFIFCGYRREGTSLSFALENGSHAGPGPEETCGMALLPIDAPVASPEAPHLRPDDLRRAALYLMKRGPRPIVIRPPRAVAHHRRLRIMTYNVHACIGMDGKLSPARIARVISQSGADVVALQELDVRRRRTGDVDQAHEIAHLLEMDFHFHPAWQIEEELYGDAILTHFPLRLVRSGDLPGWHKRPRLEPRGALWTEIDVDGQVVHVLNTHLGLRRREQLAQVEALLSDRWLADPQCCQPVILCGDFNASPRSRPYANLCGVLHDAQRRLNGHRPLATFLSGRPFHRIDHIFVSADIEVQRIAVPRTELASVASDHLPLIVDVRLP